MCFNTRLCAVTCLLLLLGGCASTPQTRQLETQIPSSLPAAFELKQAPFNPQSKYQCGPAALATVLQFHEYKISPEQLVNEVYIPQRKGSLQIEIGASARRHQMLPYVLNPELEDLLAEIAAGHPVLVFQNLGFAWYPQWHYAVAIGYDLQQQHLILRSGTEKRWITPFKVFERTWQRADHWALVILPVGQIPQTANAGSYLQIAHAFEQTAQSDLAYKAYKAASIKWPDNHQAWMLLGNMAYQQNDYPGAVNAFSKVTQLDTYHADGWNNLAYALLADSCSQQAVKALQCGLKIAPDNKNLQDSWQEISQQSDRPERKDCPPVGCEKLEAKENALKCRSTLNGRMHGPKGGAQGCAE
ncbi:MAG TPA: PA2778 family cysteine peptidase [Gammaproteobacteria bacterium]